MRRLGDPSFNKLGIKTVPWGLGRSGGQYFQKVLNVAPNNLIGYWIMDEAAGAVAIDSSPEGNDGAYTGVTLGQPGIGDGRTCPLFDGVNDFNNIFSAGFAADFDGAEGGLLSWHRITAAVWADGVRRWSWNIGDDAANRLYTTKQAAVNRIDYIYTAGGVMESIAATPFSPTDWFSILQTWSAADDEFRVYVNGVLEPIQVGLGVWAGVLGATTTLIGARTTAPISPFDGLIAHTAIWAGLGVPAILQAAAADLAVV